jgi:hypothetical protein
MHIRNTGWQEVTESDFTSADYVEVSVPDAETLAGASVTAVSDPSVYPVGPLDQALVKVELRPRSMKRKSWLKLQLIVDGGGQPTVSANFTGRSRPMRELVATAIKRGWLWVYFAIPVIGVVGIADVSLFAHPVLSWLAVVVMATILSAMLVLRRRIKRAKRGVR